MNLRIVTYTRVSSDEQAFGFSLRDQDVRLTEQSAREQDTVVASFQDDFTGKTFDRPGFKEMMRYVRSNQVDEIRFINWRRFSRDTTEALVKIKELKKLGVRVQAIDEPIDTSNPMSKYLLHFSLTAGEVDNDMRTDATIRGMRRANTEGRHLGTAPTGYKNARDEQRKPIIIPDSKAPYVRKAFEMIFEGKTQSEARELLRKEGYKVVRSHFHTMLRNEVYIGNIVVPAYKNEPQKTVKGIHEPLITESLFYQVQDILNGKKRTQPRKRLNTSEHFPLKGFLYCFEYDHKLTGSCSCYLFYFHLIVSSSPVRAW